MTTRIRTTELLILPWNCYQNYELLIRILIFTIKVHFAERSNIDFFSNIKPDLDRPRDAAPSCACSPTLKPAFAKY